MVGPIILFADNDPEFLDTRAELLIQEGYALVRATNPTDARRSLEQYSMDLAILDLRLRDDGDEKDDSGLTLAREVARFVPKIILTGHSFSWEAVREALRQRADGSTVAVDFVTKQEGPEVLLLAVRRALRDPVGPDPAGVEYNLRAIHELVVEAYTAGDLKRFCLYRELFRPALVDVGDDASVDQLAEALIRYCMQRLYIPELLADIEAERPRQFKRYWDRLHSRR